jgi:CheY-like chemotaxis protein
MILLIEDDEMMRSLVEWLLRDKGYKVITVGDGVEAVNAYRRFWPEIEVVISDLEMPKLDGFEAYKQMRALNPALKIIIASGYIDSRTKSKLQLEGVRHFIHKPYTPDQILHAIQELMKAE